MFKCLQLMLTLALFSVVTQPAAAQNAPPPPPFEAGIVSGNHDETIEIAYNLRLVRPDGGQSPLISAPNNCHVAFEITGTQATGGSSYATTEIVNLYEGETQVVKFNFDEFNPVGRSHVILTVTNAQTTGGCVLLSADSLVDTTTGATRASGNISFFNSGDDTFGIGNQ